MDSRANGIYNSGTRIKKPVKHIQTRRSLLGANIKYSGHTMIPNETEIPGIAIPRNEIPVDTVLTTAYYFPESSVIRVGPHISTRSSSSSSQPISPAAPSAKYIEYCRPSFIHHQLIEEEDNNQPASVIQGNVVEPEQMQGATAIKVGSGLARLPFSLRLRPPKTKTPPPN